MQFRIRFRSSIRSSITSGVIALALATAGLASGSTRTRHTAKKGATVHHTSYRQTSSWHSRHSRHARISRHHFVPGQRVMDSQRATQIQQALIQAHYLDGAPTGQWDAASQAAMEKYQTDNGWQSKITPDSRALIKLGLGPKQDEGEYSTTASNASDASDAGNARLSSNAPSDTIRSMATSELPLTAQN